MKPYIICHMMESVDGRVACDMVDKISGDEYYDALDSLGCQAFVEGKHSYQIHYCGFEEFKTETPVAVGKEEVFVACTHDQYQVSVDTLGKLMWNNLSDNNHICIVSERASRQYLDYLSSQDISYIAVGKEFIDLRRAMEILHDSFGVERVAVVGGGKINGGFLSAGLLDEVSVMIAPGIDGRIGQPALFDSVAAHSKLPTKLSLKSIEKFDNEVVWIKYNII